MLKADSLEKCRKMKEYDRSEFWDIAAKEGGFPAPWRFGCPDYHHDETGAVNYWVPPDPNKDWDDLPDNRIPVEQQKYRSEKEDTQWNNLQHGWSGMVDLGLVYDYWKHYNEWN